jgi:hypothetical protein
MTKVIKIMKTFFLALLLLSTTMSIKIKIRTPRSSGSSSSQGQTGGWNTNRSCGPIAPQVDVGSLFSIYAEQLYSIFNDPINELLLVKHERQIVAGVNHRIIFRVRDKQTNDKLFIGMSLYVDLQGNVRVTGYLESFDKNDIVKALGFSNGRLFRYRCNDLNNVASSGFVNWAQSLIGGLSQTSSHQDDLSGFDDFNQPQTHNQPSYGQVPPQTQPSYGQVPPQTQPVQNQFGGDDSPFEEKTININIRGRNPDGSQFLIGSSRPKATD